MIHLYARPIAIHGLSDIGPRTETWCRTDGPDDRCTSHVGLVTCTDCLLKFRRLGIMAEQRLKVLQVDYTQVTTDLYQSQAMQARELGVDLTDLHARLSDALGVMLDEFGWGHGAPDWIWIALVLIPVSWRDELLVRLRASAVS